MRILVVHNRYRSCNPSGENRVVDQETQALQRAGHAVEHFERNSDEIDSMPLARKALVPTQVVWSQSAARDMGRAIGSFKPDVVHVHNTFPLLSPSVLRAARRHLVPVVQTLHNYRQICPSGDLFRDGRICHDCVGRSPLPALEHGCYRDSRAATVPIALGQVLHKRMWQTLASAYIFISGWQRDVFSALELPKQRCFVKSNLVYPMNGRGETEPCVAYIGRIEEVKGIPFLMQAWDRFESHGLRLAIAGAGALSDEVRDWAEKRSDVDHLGLLSRSDCADLLARARATVVPSQWEEPFGLVVPEAMSANVPAIAPSHGAFPELISDGVDGVLFAPGDVDALSRLFKDVESEPERWAALGQKARLTYEQRFQPESNVEHLEAIYRFAIEHPVWIELDQAEDRPQAKEADLPAVVEGGYHR